LDVIGPEFKSRRNQGGSRSKFRGGFSIIINLRSFIPRWRSDLTNRTISCTSALPLAVRNVCVLRPVLRIYDLLHKAIARFALTRAKGKQDACHYRLSGPGAFGVF
jgi:hypothetical protein